MDIKSIKNGKLINGDASNELKHIPSDSLDTIVTDPPYGYSFMGKNWDKALPDTEIFKECLRVLKPGAFAFIMAAPRQDVLSRMIIKLEDAGFKVDFTSIYWTYATGFPKAHNIGKKDKRFAGSFGGFQPKPAVEVIIVVQKPFTQKTQVGQALDNGKGVTWLGDCRIPYSDGDKSSAGNRTATFGTQETISGGDGSVGWKICKEGRFPANLLVSDNVLDDGKDHKSCIGPSQINPDYSMKEGFMQKQKIKSKAFYGDKGGYSRFFSLDAWIQRNLPFLIVPKASKKEKNAGLQDREKQTTDDGRKKTIDNPFQRGKTLRNNSHPTVKPIKLMSYLITMGSREGDIVLDPFCGSGTTCLAARLLGRKFIGIEIEKKYFEIARERLTNIRGEIKSTDTSLPEPEKVHRLSELESFEIRLLGGPFLDGTALKKLPDLINKTFDRLTEVTFEEDGFRVTPTIAPTVEIGPEKTNVQDWADKTINVYKGCSNDCRYCYAREEAVRFNRVKKEDWAIETLNPAILKKGWRLSKKNLMFPSTHDITPGTYDGCETVLKKLLEAGNTVLVVSKPRPDLIERLCDALEAYKKQILFRFTISAQDNDLLVFWEPNAPSYEDRKKALKIAHEKGFMTSVSIEPMLDPANVEALIEDLRPHTSDSMWIGTMNMIRKRVKKESAQVEAEIVKIITGQTPERLRTIYMRYQDDPMIKWKGHVRKALKEVRIEVPAQKDDWRERIPK